ncbi:MAG: tetratricopeptide repeat protein [Gloeobacteraceae cyanobacterium ES-bin-144]|nr:tetratricopeptide repeat protein [Verrucomicrobiales bacterium]
MPKISLSRLMAAILLLCALAPQSEAHGTHSSLMARVDERLVEKPEDGGLWFQRAVLQFEHEDHAAAAVDFAKAEKFAPGEYAVLWWQGRISEAQGNLAEARTAFDAYLSQVPNHWGALASRARVNLKIGNTGPALDDFRAALENCKDAQPDLIQEVAQALASNKRTDEAVAVLEIGMSRLGPIPSLQLNLLEVEANAERFDSALARVEGFQKAAVRPEPWMQKRASILARAGRLTQSRSAWTSLIAHLNALPPAERESHAMVLLAEHARQALQVLAAVPTTPDTQNPLTRLNL